MGQRGGGGGGEAEKVDASGRKLPSLESLQSAVSLLFGKAPQCTGNQVSSFWLLRALGEEELAKANWDGTYNGPGA